MAHPALSYRVVIESWLHKSLRTLGNVERNTLRPSSASRGARVRREWSVRKAEEYGLWIAPVPCEGAAAPL
jgi:hypothetical protein